MIGGEVARETNADPVVVQIIEKRLSHEYSISGWFNFK